MEPQAAVRALHILSSALWAGSAVFLAFVLGPSLRKAGAAAGPFMAVVLRRGGFSGYFLTLGVVAVLSGGYLYGKGVGKAAFDGAGNTVLTVGVILAILALLDGFIVLMPNERRMKAIVRSMPQGPPPPETASRMQALGEKQGKASAAGAALILAALVCMVLSRTLA